MKKLVLLSITLSLTFLACEVDESQENTTTSNLTTSITDLNRGVGFPGDNFSQSVDWAAYLVGDILSKNSNLRNLAQAHLDPVNLTISAEALLAQGGTLGFRDKFIERYHYYRLELQEDSSGPGLGGGTLPGNKNSPGEPQCPTCGDVTVQMQPVTFINYLLENNCVEFYFPKGFDFSSTMFVTCAAHPFAISNSTKAYTHNDTDEPTVLDQLSSSYVSSSQETIILGRPVRRAADPNCVYDQYNVPSFTDFLAGPF